MAWRNLGSPSRSVMSAARSPLLRSPPAVPRIRPSPSSAPRLHSRRLSFAPSRYLIGHWINRAVCNNILRQWECRFALP